MNYRKLQYVVTLLVAFVVTSTASSSAFVDAPAPDFALRGLDGKTLRLSEFRSEVVLLSFSSDWCAKCRQSMPYFESLHRQYQSAGLNVLGVDIDGDAKSAAEIAKELRISFPVLLDTHQDVSRLYDLNQLPVTLLIDREGTVRMFNKGFRGDSGAEISAEVARLLAEK